MSTQENDKWLDELISRSIDTTKPEFDAEEWKRKYPDAFQNLLARRAKPAVTRKHNLWRIIVAPPTTGLAAAALVFVVIGLFLARDRQALRDVTPEPSIAIQSPTELVSMMSLRMAYQRGGWDALDQQFQKTLEQLGPGSVSLSVQQLLEGSNGS